MAHENNAGEDVATVKKMLDDMNNNIEVIPSSVMKILMVTIFFIWGYEEAKLYF
jgi:hypothetical protein